MGKKTAERLVVELKDKVGALATAPSSPAQPQKPTGQRADLVGALVNLGCRPAQAGAAAEEAAGPGASLDVLIREALRAARS